MSYEFSITSFGMPPLVFIDGAPLAVVQCSYNWLTKTDKPGHNTLVVSGYLGEKFNLRQFAIDVDEKSIKEL